MWACVPPHMGVRGHLSGVCSPGWLSSLFCFLVFAAGPHTLGRLAHELPGCPPVSTSHLAMEKPRLTEAHNHIWLSGHVQQAPPEPPTEQFAHFFGVAVSLVSLSLPGTLYVFQLNPAAACQVLGVWAHTAVSGLAKLRENQTWIHSKSIVSSVLGLGHCVDKFNRFSAECSKQQGSELPHRKRLACM